MTQKVKVIDRGAVREVRLSRPDVHNALDPELIEGLRHAFHSIAADAERSTDLRVVVLSGEGRSFCAGADVEYMRTIASHGDAENREDARRLSAMLRSVRTCPVVVLARVQGAALGGGSGLVACADIGVASADARFGFTEVRFGIIPAIISPFAIDRIGPARARALFTTGERFDAADALRFGLIDRVVAAEQLDTAVESVIENLLASAPAACREAKRLIDRVASSWPYSFAESEPIFGETADLTARLRGSAEGQEGLRAFLEKRPASWVKKPT